MKNILKMMIAFAMVGMLSGCSAVVADKREDYSNKTLTGMISEINNTTLTLELGKLKKADKSETEKEQPVQNNDGQIAGESDGQIPQEFNGEKPELPEDFDGQMPQNGQGQMMHGHGNMEGTEEIVQMPDAFNGQMPEDIDGERPKFPEDFDGQMPQGTTGQMNEGNNGQMMKKPEMVTNTTAYTFKKKSGTATIDIRDVTVTLADGSAGTSADLKQGDVVKITVDENNDVSSVTVYQVEAVEE